ncbi:MAG: HAD family hydrolase [Lachnospiraceae bacterium]|nr:HAD family hydrolase [Lachnospiraceae bacterium]
MKKAIIFDLDHTLYDFVKPHLAAIEATNRYMHDKFGFTMEEADEKGKEAYRRVKQKVGEATAATHSRTLRYQTLCEENGQNAFLHAHIMADLYWDTFLSVMEGDDAVLPVLKALKARGIRIILGTDMTADIQFKKVEKLGLGNVIDYMVTSEEAGGEKPSARILDLCLKKAGCDKSEAVFIGDHPLKDVTGPIAYGLDAVWCRHFNPEKFLDMMGIAVDIKDPIPYRFERYEDCVTPDGISFGGLQI